MGGGGGGRTDTQLSELQASMGAQKLISQKKVLIRDFLPALLALKSTFSLRFLRIR